MPDIGLTVGGGCLKCMVDSGAAQELFNARATCFSILHESSQNLPVPHENVWVRRAYREADLAILRILSLLIQTYEHHLIYLMGVFWRVVFISHLFVGLSLHIKIPKGHPIWRINYWECMEGHLTSPHPFFGAPCHLRKEGNRTPWKAQTKGTPATQTWTERDGSGLYWWFGPFPNQGREGSQSVAIVPKVVLCLNDVGFWIVFPLWFDQPPRGIYIIAPFGKLYLHPYPWISPGEPDKS